MKASIPRPEGWNGAESAHGHPKETFLCLFVYFEVSAISRQHIRIQVYKKSVFIKNYIVRKVTLVTRHRQYNSDIAFNFFK